MRKYTNLFFLILIFSFAIFLSSCAKRPLVAPDCTVLSPLDCTKDECDAIGLEWCMHYYVDDMGNLQNEEYCGHFCQECSSDSVGDCYTVEDCVAVGGEWCSENQAPYCSDRCPKCSKDYPHDCLTEGECVNVGGSWCTKEGLDEQGNSVITGYCDKDCVLCKVETPWECQTEAGCVAVGGEWCSRDYIGENNQSFKHEFCDISCG